MRLWRWWTTHVKFVTWPSPQSKAPPPRCSSSSTFNSTEIILISRFAACGRFWGGGGFGFEQMSHRWSSHTLYTQQTQHFCKASFVKSSKSQKSKQHFSKQKPQTGSSASKSATNQYMKFPLRPTTVETEWSRLLNREERISWKRPGLKVTWSSQREQQKQSLNKRSVKWSTDRQVW